LGEKIFPLQVGENYGDKSYPCLAVAQSNLVPVFLPLVGFLKDAA
jgi:myo-inositol-1(or 4)-monophosphatase